MTLKEFTDRVEEYLGDSGIAREELETIVAATVNQLHQDPEGVADLLPQFVPRSRLNI